MKNAMLCGVTLVAVIALPSTAYATYPGGKGSITFVDNESDRGDAGFTDLSRITPKGTRVPSLARCEYDQGEGPAKDCPSSGASFSKRGTQAAFALDHRLVVSAADGAGYKRLPKLTDQDDDVAWTRGAAFVFTGLKAGKRNIYLVNSNGTGLQQLTTNGGATPAFSNLGYVAYSAGGVIHLVKPFTKKPNDRRLAHGTKPDFSPSGKSIVYQRRGRLYTIPTRKGGKRRSLGRKGRDAVFSPDGKRILYVGAGREAGQNLLFTVSTRGKKRHTVFDPKTETAVEQESLSDPSWQALR